MSKLNMLKKNYEFRAVLSKGKYFSGNHIEAFILENKRKTNFLGIAISSKICNAVGRNNIKRLVRESYRLNEPFIKKGYTVVVLWKKKSDVSNAIFENVNKDMKKILKKADIIEVEK